jgi:hypothetical protein
VPFGDMLFLSFPFPRIAFVLVRLVGRKRFLSLRGISSNPPLLDRFIGIGGS